MIKDILKDYWEDNKMVFIIVLGFIFFLLDSVMYQFKRSHLYCYHYR